MRDAPDSIRDGALSRTKGRLFISSRHSNLLRRWKRISGGMSDAENYRCIDEPLPTGMVA